MSNYAQQKLDDNETALYHNVQTIQRNSQYFQNVDNQPLPPPPPMPFNSTYHRQPNQQVKFPPPPKIPSGLPASDNKILYGNNNNYENSYLPNSKEYNNIYANINPGTSEGIYDSIYESIDLTKVSSASHNSISQSKNNCAVSNFSNPQPIQSSPNSANTIRSNFANNKSLNNNNNSGHNRSSENPQTAIYANLSLNNIQLGANSSGYKPNSAPFKNYLRVNRTSTTKEEDQVDHLTDLLVKSMENSAEPDFFGMCNKCGEKVVGEGSGCTAMEMVYHIQCFTCFACNKELRGKPFYAMEGNPHCDDCYMNTLEKCSVCEKPILDRILRATGKPYHPSCFTCVVCKKSLDGIPFTVDASNQIHCIDDFHKKFAPRCSVCNEPIIPEPGKSETVRVVALDRSFHVICYKCEDCDLLLSSETEERGCYPLDGHILCRGCNAKRVQAITAN